LFIISFIVYNFCAAYMANKVVYINKDGDLKLNLSNKTANIYGKNFPVYNQV